MSKLLRKCHSISLLITVMLFIGGQQLHYFAGHDKTQHGHEHGLSTDHSDCVFCSVSLQLEDDKTPELSIALACSEHLRADFFTSQHIAAAPFYFSLRAPPAAV